MNQKLDKLIQQVVIQIIQWSWSVALIQNLVGCILTEIEPHKGLICKIIL